MIKHSKKLNSSVDYTWEINTKDFQFGTQRGYITLADIDAFVGELISTYKCTATHPTKDTWYLTDLSFSDYEDLERNYWKEVGYYISAKSENVNSSRRGAKMIKTTKKLNSARNAGSNASITLSRFDWRLTYSCVALFEERLDEYKSTQYEYEYNIIMKTIESALHGSWDTLKVGRYTYGDTYDDDTRPYDVVESDEADNRAVTINFTVLEAALIYKAVYMMEDSMGDSFVITNEDRDKCYAIREDLKNQLQMTEDDIFNTTDVSANRRNTKMIKTTKKLNSATNAQFNEKAFDHYLKNLVADCVDYVGECGDVVQIIEHMYPGYDWRWAAEGTDLDWDLARKELEDALYKYLKIQYLAYK